GGLHGTGPFAEISLRNRVLPQARRPSAGAMPGRCGCRGVAHRTGPPGFPFSVVSCRVRPANPASLASRQRQFLGRPLKAGRIELVLAILECGGWTPLWMFWFASAVLNNQKIQSGVQPPHSKSAKTVNAVFFPGTPPTGPLFFLSTA